jgi:DDE superfamily endonuclease
MNAYSQDLRKMIVGAVEMALAPSLRSGQVVVMVNLLRPTRERVRELIEERGCEVAYLPPYTPDLNLIERTFSKLKGCGAGPKPAAARR